MILDSHWILNTGCRCGWLKSGRRVLRPGRRDLNIFNEVGIPAATFGMPRTSASDAPERFVEIRDIVGAAKMYALGA